MPSARLISSRTYGVPLARIAELSAGDEILIGPDFYATITEVRERGFEIETEYCAVMRVSADAIESIPVSNETVSGSRHGYEFRKVPCTADAACDCWNCQIDRQQGRFS